MADKTYQSGKEKVKQYVSALESKAFFVADTAKYHKIRSRPYKQAYRRQTIF